MARGSSTTRAPAAAPPAAGASAPTSSPPAAPLSPPGGAPSAGSSSTSRLNPTGFAPTAGGVILGMLAVVLFVQYSRGGWSEVKAWLAAKFLNNATGSVGAGTSAIGQGAQSLGQGITLGAAGSGGQSGAGTGGNVPSSPPTNKGGLL
jgi:hypothetical protein